MLRTVGLVVLALLGLHVPVAGAGWSAPRPLSAQGGDASEPEAALGDDGRFAIVWERRMGDGTTVDIEGRFGRLDGELGPVQTIAHVDGGGLEAPDVAIAPDGRTLVVWEQGFTRVMEIAAGATSGPVATLATRSTQFGRPSAHFDGAGNATVFWRGNDDGYTRGVAVNTRPAAGSWTGERDALVMPGGTLQQHAAAAGGDGAAVVVGAAYDHAYMSTRPHATADFGAPEPLTTPEVEWVRWVDATMDRAGNALVVWEEILKADPDKHRRLRARYRRAGATFGPVVTLARIGHHGGSARARLLPDGRPLVAWNGGAYEPFASERVTFVAGTPEGGWSAPGRLAGADVSMGDGFHDLGVDGDGSIYLVWRRYDHPASYFGRAYAAVRPAGGPAGSPAALSGGGTNVWPPVVAVNPVVAGAVTAYPSSWRIEAVTHDGRIESAPDPPAGEHPPPDTTEEAADPPPVAPETPAGAVAPPPPPPSPSPSPGAARNPNPRAGDAQALARLLLGRLSTARWRGGRTAVRLPEPAPWSFAVRLSVRRQGRTVTVATGRCTAGCRTLTVRRRKGAAPALRAARRGRARVLLALRPAGGAPVRVAR